jgi:hypothetical protein
VDPSGPVYRLLLTGNQGQPRDYGGEAHGEVTYQLRMPALQSPLL